MASVMGALGKHQSALSTTVASAFCSAVSAFCEDGRQCSSSSRRLTPESAKALTLVSGVRACASSTGAGADEKSEEGSVSQPGEAGSELEAEVPLCHLPAGGLLWQGRDWLSSGNGEDERLVGVLESLCLPPSSAAIRGEEEYVEEEEEEEEARKLHVPADARPHSSRNTAHFLKQNNIRIMFWYALILILFYVPCVCVCVCLCVCVSVCLCVCVCEKVVHPFFGRRIAYVTVSNSPATFATTF